jgi:hypothetical protein
MKKIVDINTGWHEKIIINQDDVNEILQIEIQKDRKKFDVTGYKAKAYFRLPNGEVVKQDCLIENKLVNIELKRILIDKGKVEMEIIFTKDDKRTTTFSIDITVK